MSRAAKARRGRGQLRIIGGQWRGRKLAFPAIDGLRPTTDRVRETVFNWLAPHLHAARCLDLFAGSGALGLEALSRGADSCTFVDSAAQATRQIQDHLQTLDATQRGHCRTLAALDFLKGQRGPWDIVFIDPPFGKALVEPCCALLQSSGALAPGAMVYVESGADESLPALPGEWETYREKRAGDVCYRLFIVSER